MRRSAFDQALALLLEVFRSSLEHALFFLDQRFDLMLLELLVELFECLLVLRHFKLLDLPVLLLLLPGLEDELVDFVVSKVIVDRLIEVIVMLV